MNFPKVPTHDPNIPKSQVIGDKIQRLNNDLNKTKDTEEKVRIASTMKSLEKKRNELLGDEFIINHRRNLNKLGGRRTKRSKTLGKKRKNRKTRKGGMETLKGTDMPYFGNTFKKYKQMTEPQKIEYRRDQNDREPINGRYPMERQVVSTHVYHNRPESHHHTLNPRTGKKRSWTDDEYKLSFPISNRDMDHAETLLGLEGAESLLSLKEKPPKK
jgi:hypothetical protein